MKRTYLQFAFTWLAAVALMAVSCASSGPATRRPAKLKPGDRAERIPADHCRIMGIDIRRDNITDIEALLGRPIFYYRGEFDVGNCYVSRDGIFFEFYISPTRTGYAVSKILKNDAPAENCGSLDVVSAALANAAGLKLGLSRTQVHDLLGPPSRQQTDSDEDLYIFWVQEKADDATAKKIRETDRLPSDHEVWVNIYSVIKVFFEQDQVAGFDVNTSDAFR